ncbi:sensor histidine kinase [Streptomyces sp. NPDC093586]|uniref:sensor histidine kinase n=1 Tax=Streptomyces sp. NPDC093586 TaxID=3366042 RepID=UPI0037F5FC7E
MDAAEISRTGRPLLSRLTADSPWTRGRIAGETALALALSGTAGILHGTEPGSPAWAGPMALLIALLTPARRALPATVLVVSSALAGVAVGAIPLLVCASWSAGHRITRPGRALAAYGVGLVLHIGVEAGDQDGGTGLSLPLTIALSGMPFLVLSVVPGLVSRYRAQRRALIDALHRHNAQLVREQEMVARQARLLERQRIAQDMHDSLGHQLALIAVQAGALEVDPELTGRRREGVGVLREAARSAMQELRETVGILRDDGEEPAGRWGDAEDAGPSAARTAAAVDTLVESSRAAGAAVELRRSGTERPLAPAADQTAYRIVQEGLTNALKHAPGAPITVALRYEPDSLVVEVANGPVPADAPAGPPAVSGGQGLTGLAERARLVGGMVHRGPTGDGGFRLAGVLPYSDGEARSRPDGATSVAAGSDFGGQPARGAAGDGGPVIDHRGPHKEYAAIMSSKKNVALGCALTAVVLVVGAGALVFWVVGKLMDEVERGVIPASVYESARVGDPEADLRKKFPQGDSLLTEGVEKDGPPLPEDAACEHFVDEDEDIVYRFCFRDGKLSSKVSYAHRT